MPLQNATCAVGKKPAVGKLPAVRKKSASAVAPMVGVEQDSLPNPAQPAPVATAANVAPAVVADPRIRCFAGDATAAEAAARAFEAASAQLGAATTRLFDGVVDLVALEIFAPPMQEQRAAIAGVYCVVVQAT